MVPFFNRLRYLLIAGLFFTVMQLNSYAGGLPVRPGSLVVSTAVNYFFANKEWDTLRHKIPFPQNGQFTSITYSLYAEYGISKRFSFVASLPYVFNNYHQDNYQGLSQGFTDLETGIKYYVGNINYIYYFTIQGTFISPLYANTSANQSLGYGEHGAELKASFFGSGKFFTKNYYFTVENAVRQYFGGTGPFQDRYNGTLGLTLDRKFKHQVSVSLTGFYSTSSLTQFNVLQYASNKNFAFNQVSLSYGYAFGRGLSAFVTAGKFIDGRNTGAGSTASLSLIFRPLRGI